MWSKSTGIKLLKLKLVDVYFLVLITKITTATSFSRQNDTGHAFAWHGNAAFSAISYKIFAIYFDFS